MKKLSKLTIIALVFVFFSLASGFTAEKGSKVVVIMYHGIVENNKNRNTYVITPAELEKDIQYLINNGYEILTCEDLLSGTKGKKRLNKTAVLTFDDGFYGNYKFAVPLFKKYNISGVFAVVGCYAFNKKLTDKNSIFAYMDWDDIKNASRYVEIASHTYDMHELKGRKGVSKNQNETIDEYLSAIKQDFNKNHKYITKYCKEPVTFAYPYGIYNKYTEQVLKDMGYKITLTCNEGINYVTNEDSLRLLKRFNRDGKMSSMEFMKKYKI